MMAEVEARRIVYERSGWCCEICSLGAASEWHHRRNRSQGGLWEPANGLHLCSGCHRFVTEHPRTSDERGWTVRGWELPQLKPAHISYGLVLLDNGGGFSLVEDPWGR